MVVKHKTTVTNNRSRTSFFKILDSISDFSFELIVQNAMLACFEIETLNFFVMYVTGEGVWIPYVTQGIL